MQVQELFPGTVCCILCRGMVIYKDGDKTRFIAHMANEHGAFFDIDYLLASSMMENDQKASVAIAVDVPGNAEKEEARAEAKTTFKCDSCNTQFGAKTVYLQHISKGCKKDIIKTRFNCEGCEKSYATQQKLKVHIENVHLDAAGPTSIKQEVLMDQPSQEMDFMDGLNSFKDVGSSQSFSNFIEPERIMDEDLTLNSTLDEHSSSTPKEKKFSCSPCDKKFQSKQGLGYHIAKKHSNTDGGDSSFDSSSTSLHSSSSLNNSSTSLNNSSAGQNNISSSLNNSSSSLNTSSSRLYNSYGGIDISQSGYFTKNPTLITKARGASVLNFEDVAVGLPDGWRVRTLQGQGSRVHRHYLTPAHIVLKTSLGVVEFLRMEGQTGMERIMEIANALNIREKKLQSLLQDNLPTTSLTNVMSF